MLRARSLWKALLIVAIIGSALLLAACGGSSSSSDTGTGETAASAEETETSQGSTESAAKPEGAPIKVMTISVRSSEIISLPEAFDGVQAAAAEVNAEGGINGHPVEVSECSSDFDPNKETACLKQAVSEDVTAVVGSYLFFPGGVKILEAAGIPYFGGTGDTPEEQTSPLSFLIPIQLSEDYGLASMMVEAGSKKNVTIMNETSPSVAANENVSEALELAGFPPLERVEAPPGQPDYGAAVASALSKNPETVTDFEALTDAAKVVKDLRQANFEGAISVVGGTLTQEVIESMGSAGDGVTAANGVVPLSDTSVPAVEQFKEAMATYRSSGNVNYFSEVSYAAMKLFAEVAKTVTGEIDAKSFVKAADAVTTPIDVELIPPWVGSGTPPIKKYPRAFIYGYIPTEISGEELIATGEGEFVEPIEAIEGQ